MGRWQRWHRTAAGTLTAVAVAGGGLLAAPPGSAATTPICHSGSHSALAGRMSTGILSSFRGRASHVGIYLKDPSMGMTCSYHSSWQFYSASTVKATILAAMLRKNEQNHRSLTTYQRNQAWLMITQSDNTAATHLWDQTGRYWLQHFLNLAKMNHTVLGPGGYWGLTLETAYDESLLLNQLVRRNSVLTASDRSYALYLMAHVISSQRWGVPAGVPTSYTVHVKNGWLPVSGYGWFINSLGAFTKKGSSYTMDVLTDRNPSMSYGITTVEDIATVANHDLNPGTSATVARSAPSASWGTPDESISVSAATQGQ